MQEAHEQLSKIASATDATSSCLRGSISFHTYEGSVLFSVARRFYEQALPFAATSKGVMIGLLNGRLVFSVLLRGGFKPDAPLPPSDRREKRRLSLEGGTDDDGAGVDPCKRIKLEQEGTCDKPPDAVARLIARAEAVIRGPNGECVLESIVASTTRGQRSVIACRLSPGLAAPLQLIFEAFGNNATDGIFAARPDSAHLDTRLTPSKLYGLGATPPHGDGTDDGVLCVVTAPATAPSAA